VLGRPRAAPRPTSARFEPVDPLRGFTHWFTSVAPSRLANRTRPVWQYQAVPASSGLLAVLPGASRIRLPPASTGPLRQAGGESSHLARSVGASWRTGCGIKARVGVPAPVRAASVLQGRRRLRSTPGNNHPARGSGRSTSLWTTGAASCSARHEPLCSAWCWPPRVTAACAAPPGRVPRR